MLALARRGLDVWAVDPGELAPEVRALPGVHHLPIKVGALRWEERGAALAPHHGMAKAKNPRGGLQKPVEPDEALAAIVGRRAQPRSEMTRRLWDYIKQHHLQDPEDGRVIHPDGALGRVVGERDVSMLELGRLMNAHVRS